MTKLIWLEGQTAGHLVSSTYLGVLPEYRAQRVDALFYYESAKAALKGEMSWFLENNDAISRPIQMMGGEVYKTYRFYMKGL
jgi:hypothetical protein